MKKKINLLLIFFVIAMVTFAQGLTITGKVTEQLTNDPLTGVTVKVEGKNVGTVTDLDGNYSIAASIGDVLSFSFVGMHNATIKVASSDPINVAMQNDDVLLDQVVVIGYGSIKRSELSGAVATISSKDLQTNVASSVSSALQGKVAGVTVTSTGGGPGSGMNINIRGVGSINNTIKPLYVIDGVYGDINTIDPSDITSMEILKDGAAAAIYGSRAANGVVIISTKGGRKNMPLKVDVSMYGGFQNITKKLDVMDGNQWKSFITTHHDVYKVTPQQDMIDWSGKGTNWQDEGYSTAAIYKTNINLSGGAENSTYNVSAGYLNQEGVMINSGFDAVNMRAKNMFYMFNDHVRLGSTLYVRSWKQKKNWSVVTDYLTTNPMTPLYDESNELGGYGKNKTWMRNGKNPVGEANLNALRNKGTDININGFLDVDLYLEGLTYKLNVGYTKNDSNGYQANPKYDIGEGEVNSKIKEDSYFGSQWLVENTLNYSKTFNEKHSVSALAGYSAQKNKNRTLMVERHGVPGGVSSIGGAPSVGQSAGGYANESSMTSVFGRVMYSYDSRYMLSTSIRRDGSSKFSDGHRYGNYPGVSVGWNIMNEDFFSPLKGTVSELKLRGSYGELGNQEISNYATQNIVSNNLHYVLQGGGMWEGNITGANWVSPRDLSWEKTKTYDVGIDATLWNGKLNVTTDFYIKRSENILLNVDMPVSGGLTGSPVMNAGTIENKGFEFAANYRNNINDFNYNIGFNISTVKNKVKEVTVGNFTEIFGWKGHADSEINAARVGDPIGQFYLVKTDGIFQSKEEVLAHVDKNGKPIQPNAQPGDIRYLKNPNNDAEGISYADRQKVGNPFPDFTYGIRLSGSYKMFDLSLFFEGSQGNDIYNYTRAQMETTTNLWNYSTRLSNSWTESNTRTSIPRYVATDDLNKNNYRVSDRWLESGSYFRLKTLELGYTLPKALLQKIQIENLRVYFATENLFTITGYKGYTPDLGQNEGENIFTNGVDYGRYPDVRTFTLGFQLNF